MIVKSGESVRASQEMTLDGLRRSYSHALTRFFRRRVGNSDDIPDLIQDVFLRLANLKDLSEIRQPERYLFSTASSALHDQLRRDKVRQRNAHQEFDEDCHGGSELSPERIIAGKFAVRKLRDVIARLPERPRDIFVLRTFEDMSTKDIALALGISQRAVEKQYAKALAKVTLAMKAYRDV